MAELQRSVQTFRRTGSSGLVWDGKSMSGELRPTTKSSSPPTTKSQEESLEFRNYRHSRSVGSAMTMGRHGKRGRKEGYYAANVSPSLDPPSPDLSGCDLICGFLVKPRTSDASKPSKSIEPSMPSRRKL